MQILRYADEVRKADPFFEKVPAIKLDGAHDPAHRPEGGR
jgi:non-homologous end joining protein Ku